MQMKVFARQSRGEPQTPFWRRATVTRVHGRRTGFAFCESSVVGGLRLDAEMLKLMYGFRRDRK